MAVHRLFLTVLLACTLLFAAARARPSPRPRQSLAAARLLSDHMTECWNSLLELRACTDEVILFFLNGETTRLGPSCCSAVRVIEHRCWPAMLTALGFSPEEGDVLTGYCDASAGVGRGTTTPLPPLIPVPSLGPAPSSSESTAGRV